MKRLPVFLTILSCFVLLGCNLGQLQLTTIDPTDQKEVTKETISTSITAPIFNPTATEIQAAIPAFPVDPVTSMPLGTDGYPWWNDSIFYEIFVRSFYDSDGDGIGDINGITQKLDYLNDGDPDTNTDLGITGIWLMPINPTPSYHGYSVTDYYDINPDYGTLDDFKALLDAARLRGIRVIIDLVMNHTSNQHPWFISASSLSSPYHDWYTWSETDPGYTGSWGQQVWFPLNGRYYYSTFSAGMPDLNYNNPAVVSQMEDVARFWLEDIGVDGFRLDAAKHIVEEGTIQANSAGTHAWWESFRLFYKEVKPDAMIVGEIWDDTPIMAEYLQGDEFDLSFEFYLAGRTIQSVNEADSSLVGNRLQMAYSLIPNQQFAVFLSNHDQERVMSQVFDDEGKAKAAAALMLTSPGVPFVYYGEEVGMQGDQKDLWYRRPMQWSAATNSGFSAGTLWEPLGPGWQSYNVEVETDNPDSLLMHYRQLIQLRNEHAALRLGDLYIIKTTDERVYSILRVSENEAVLVLVNLSGDTVSDFFLARSDSSLAEGIYSLALMMGEGEFEPIAVNASGGFFHHLALPEIPPYATVILQLQLN